MFWTFLLKFSAPTEWCRALEWQLIFVIQFFFVCLFERNKSFDFQRKCTNGRMPLREEEIVVLHPKHTVLKCPVSGFAPMWKEEISHVDESFLTIISPSPECPKHPLMWQKPVTSYSWSLAWARVTQHWPVELVRCGLVKIRTIWTYKKLKTILVSIQLFPFSWKGSNPLSSPSIACYIPVIA